MPLLTDALDARFGTDPELQAASERADLPTRVGRFLAALLSLDSRRNPKWLDHLETEGFLDPVNLSAVEPSDLIESFRVVGLKLRTADALVLIRVARWLVERHHGDFEELEALSTATLREELRQIRGLGPTTVEAVLLDGLDRFTYPLDRPSLRVLARHGWIEPWSEFDDTREFLEQALGQDPSAARRWSRWMTRLAREYCLAKRPCCENCPLRFALPEGGALQLDPDA